MEQPFSVLDMMVFFDESGNNQVKPHLMAGLAIPTKYYNNENIQQLNEKIKATKIHWTEYSGDSKERNTIWRIINTVMEHHYLLKMNVISYNQSKIEESSRKIKHVIDDIADQTIFMKFPERIVYGLLRRYGAYVHINTKIYIEDNTKYHNKKYDLRTQLFQQLNIQSIYRGERFTVTEAAYIPKQTELGIELVDLLLGMVRSIIRNDSPDKRRSREKNKLIMNLLLSNANFYSFMKTIRYYEWDSSPSLVEVDFENYLNIFMNSNLDY
ncbi:MULTISPECIES: DUF3800 domain-containing protein [Parageobacillus]|uniref:DUF3800 domain-containing protein n=1 Tax=Parageobacillus galactosidasius TaxID=883812 RepID=A0A226QNW1_9BACL|nr:MULTISPECIES: DUF3800 domain-containing protein [Parageobacillus]MED4969183.1 DUF3800 domain-containing protein [Parageobacillus toebii]OXB93079.1 hypothetical protein B9L23_18350 [Parageobacillus galactosidasius]QSB49358.1 DUF3800 domain-containing protein [Parageobacillus toebii]